MNLRKRIIYIAQLEAQARQGEKEAKQRDVRLARLEKLLGL